MCVWRGLVSLVLMLVCIYTRHRILVKVKKAAEKSAGGILLAPTMGKQRCVFFVNCLCRGVTSRVV